LTSCAYPHSSRSVDLDNLPSRYLTLSYVWGDDKSAPKCSSRLNDEFCVPITRNGYDALESIVEQFSDLSRESSAVAAASSTTSDAEIAVWVDAICINQEDSSERASQVDLMGEIYSRASACVIWLGPGSRQLHEAFSFFKLVSSHYRRLPLAAVAAQHENDKGVEMKRFREKCAGDMFGK
jgi:hypothetical protein